MHTDSVAFQLSQVCLLTPFDLRHNQGLELPASRRVRPGVGRDAVRTCRPTPRGSGPTFVGIVTGQRLNHNERANAESSVGFEIHAEATEVSRNAQMPLFCIQKGKRNADLLMTAAASASLRLKRFQRISPSASI
jgi:hypothetical protein